MRPPLALLALVAPLAASVGACVRAEGPPTQLAALTPPEAVGAEEGAPAPGGTMPLPPPPPYFPPGPERDREWLKLAPKAAVDPALARQVVDYPTPEKPGTIIVSTLERRLYLVMPGGKAMRYPVSVGKEGASWAGVANVDRKMEWPDWNPPKEMLARKPELPTRLEGGPLNPIGARSLFLAEGKRDTLFRIHGTNEPEKIGQAVSSGCIRMLNEDVMDLYERVPIGTKVVVIGDGSVPAHTAEPEKPRPARASSPNAATPNAARDTRRG